MASSATRTLPFVYGLLMRPQATPLEAKRYLSEHGIDVRA